MGLLPVEGLAGQLGLHGNEARGEGCGGHGSLSRHRHESLARPLRLACQQEGGMAKRRSSARKSTASSRKRSSGSRAGGSRRRGTAKSATAKRTARGRFKDKGRSLKADRPMKGRTGTKSGDEDRGDRAA
jgi:hypothetical protein